MKTKIFAIQLLLITLVLNGCIPSVHPLYTEDDLVFKSEILGTWIESGNEVEWVFEDSGKNSYILRITENGKLCNLDLHLVLLGDKYFFDFFPGENDHIDDMSGYLSLQFIPVHTFAKVLIDEDYMVIYRFDPSWLEEMLKENEGLIKNEITSKYILLTASTEELQGFVTQHADVDEAFLEKTMLYRK
ncbi:MAG: hypothetical protein K8S00_14545 [Bacteroidales bacterium]|nr:hypothetical protein [Bacteroidales bacterium]